MKHIICLMLLALSLSSTAAQTNNATVAFPPLPEHFRGIGKYGNPDFRPAAVYRIREGKIAYCCVGTLIPSGEKTFNIVLPEHIFMKDGVEQDIFGVRMAHPDSKGLIGFVNNIVWRSNKGSVKDVVIAEVGTNLLPIKSFSKIQLRTQVLFAGSPEVVIEQKLTKKIYSGITGKEVKILGYGVTPSTEFLDAQKKPELKGTTLTIDEKYPFVVVEMGFKPGDSGHPFYDEHGRCYIVHAGADPELPTNKDVTLKNINDYLTENGKNSITGYGFLTGPLPIEPDHSQSKK